MGQENMKGGSLTVVPNGDVLRDLRRLRSATQSDIEQGAGIPMLSLSRYERNQPICLDHLKALASFYNVSASALTNPNSADKIKAISTEIASLFSSNGKE